VKLLSARGDEALCINHEDCPAENRCRRSPTVRDVHPTRQWWMQGEPKPDGPCREWVALSDEQALILFGGGKGNG